MQGVRLRAPPAGPRRAVPPAGSGIIWRVGRTRGRTTSAHRPGTSSASRRTTRVSGRRSPEVAPDRGDRGARRARRRRPTPRRARAPRSRVPRSPRTGRARAAPATSPRIEKSASRTRSAVGPRAAPARCLEAAAAVAPLPRPSCRYRVELRAEARDHGVAQQGVLGLLELRVGAQQLVGAVARPGQQLGVLGELRHAQLGQPVLARAEHVPGPAQLEVDLGEPEAVALVRDRARAAAAWRRRRGCRASRARRGPRARAADAAARGRSARPPRSA